MKDPIVRQTITLIGAVVIALVIINVFNIAYPVQITNTMTSNELAVVGEGKVDVVPDTATVDVGISVANAATVVEAQKKIDDVNNKIIEGMKKLGIEKKNIKTSSYSIYPNYDYEGNRSVTGFNGDVQVSIKTEDTQQVTQIVQTATAAGATNVNNTAFSVKDPAKYREEARNKAIANAKEQANKIAKDLGIRLGKVTNIVESSNGGSPIMPMYDKAMVSARAEGLGGGGATFEEGTQTIQSTVTLYFEKSNGIGF